MRCWLAASLFLLMSLARHGHACMAMIPTHPSTTRPPVMTTTDPSATTTDPSMTTTDPTATTTTTKPVETTTTAEPTCISCPTPMYMAPAMCPDTFFCGDATQLTTMAMPCVSAACKPGYSMFAVAATGMPPIAVSAAGMVCNAKGTGFVDATDQAIVIASTATVYCQIMIDCTACGMEPTYVGMPTGPMISVEKSVLGCDVFTCDRQSRLTVDGDTKMTDFGLGYTCDSRDMMWKSFDLMTPVKSVDCVACSCTPQILSPDQLNLCPFGTFCYAPITSTCSSKCSGTGTLIHYIDKSPMWPTELGVSSLKCQVNGMWTPATGGLNVLCKTDVAALPTTPTPALMNCAAIPDMPAGGAGLPGADHSHLRYFVDDFDEYLATCVSGILYTLSATPGAANSPAYDLVRCSATSPWTNLAAAPMDVAMATCVTDVAFACAECKMNGLNVMEAPFDDTMFKFVISNGGCYAQCQDDTKSIMYTASDGGAPGTVKRIRCHQSQNLGVPADGGTVNTVKTMSCV